MEVDHINHNTLDNRRCNLRLATHGQNMANSRPNKGRKYKGVWQIMGKYWVAFIGKNKKQIYLGSFSTPKLAAKAYDEAARKKFGEYACLNFPNEGCHGAE